MQTLIWVLAFLFGLSSSHELERTRDEPARPAVRLKNSHSVGDKLYVLIWNPQLTLAFGFYNSKFNWQPEEDKECQKALRNNLFQSS
jgi:hypothetical protein